MGKRGIARVGDRMNTGKSRRAGTHATRQRWLCNPIATYHVRTMKTTGQPLSECPPCRYDLTGLPPNHRCPECGFEYDETMRMWVGSELRRFAIAMAAAGALNAVIQTSISIFVDRPFTTVGTGPPPTGLWASLAWTAGPFLVYALILWMLDARIRTFLIISDRGLYSKQWLRKLKFFAWSKLWVGEPGHKRAGHQPLPPSPGHGFPFNVHRWSGYLYINPGRSLLGLSWRWTGVYHNHGRAGALPWRPVRLPTFGLNRVSRRAADQEAFDRWFEATGGVVDDSGG